MSKWICAALVVALLLAAGCQSSLPKTHTAGGSVRYRGGQVMKGGSVQFVTQSDPGLRVVGQIRNDGAFTLDTVRDNAKTAGAPEGEYEVTVFPPLQGDHKGAPAVVLPTRYRIVAGEKNDFAIELTISPPT
jgi:hypothetical protein